MIRPGSCSSGLRSAPSSGTGINRANGLEVNNRNARKPMLTSAITPSTRAITWAGNCRDQIATAPVHSASTSVHSSNEPSCAPQTAE